MNIKFHKLDEQAFVYFLKKLTSSGVNGFSVNEVEYEKTALNSNYKVIDFELALPSNYVTTINIAEDYTYIFIYEKDTKDNIKVLLTSMIDRLDYHSIIID